MTPREFVDSFEEFRASSWDRWRQVLARLTPDVREFFCIAGRGSGKSRIAAVLACCFAVREYRRAPGERIYCGVFAPDRKQAQITFKYIVGLLRSVPALEALIEDETRESLTLRTGVVVEVITASSSAPRGRSYALAIVEEAAFLPNDDASADPDTELLRALRPALARVSGSLLAVIGSPYARRGVLYEAFQAGDADDRVVVAADTLSLNPSFRVREVARAFDTDPVAAASEYGRDGAIEFRADVAGLIADAALAGVVSKGVRERAPEIRRRYVAHLDAATGSGSDAAALAIACHDGDRALLVAVRQWRPPFSPANVMREAAALLRRYDVREVTLDRYAPGLVADLLRRERIDARPADRDTSTAFVDLLASINADECRLLDEPVLVRELARLERRPTSGGREHVSHPPRGHDDVAAAAAFALVSARESVSHEQRVLLSGSDVEYGERLRDRVEVLKADVQRWTSLATSLRGALARTGERLTREQRSPEEQEARQRQARRLREERRARRQAAREAHLAAIAAQQRAERQLQAQREAQLRGQERVLRAVQKYGSWFPGD